MKIAAFIDEDDHALPFYATGNVALHTWQDDSWTCIKKIPFAIDETMNLAIIQHQIFTLIAELEDCTVFVTKSMKGAPLSIFDGMGISIWDFKGAPVKIFDQIKELKDKELEDKVKAGMIKSEQIKVPVAIGPLRDGHFIVDLKKVLESDEHLTAKKVLLPFFRETIFQQLEIVCEHPPKFLEKESAALKLHVQTEESISGLYHVFVSPLV